MKPRRVTVTLEMDSDATIKDLRSKHGWEKRCLHLGTTAKVIQVHVVPLSGKPRAPAGHPWRRMDEASARERGAGGDR